VWLVLTLLQLGTWTVQENLEAVASGRRAPLGAVLGGVHALAPLVQVEVALILALGYVLVHGRFHRRRTRVEVLERLVAHRWARRPVVLPRPVLAAVPCAPLKRWGAQRWQRPPPAALLANCI
jgi:hypothetical protein